MKSILITGASSGIGAAVARDFLAAGWHVGLLARREAALREVADGHDRATILPVDVQDADAVEAAFDTFVAAAGRIDVLFNNAGLFGARAAFARMRGQDPQGGRIINNGSISAHVPRENSVCYTTTKHAITGLTKSLSLDGRAFDIACGQIDIGNARTELLEGIIETNRARGLSAPPTMDVDEAVRAVRLMADMPLSANVQFMTVMATKMPYIGRG